MNATGEELERYEAEVALDDSTFSDRLAPDFTLPDTEGRQVSLSQYRGQNVNEGGPTIGIESVDALAGRIQDELQEVHAGRIIATGRESS